MDTYKMKYTCSNCGTSFENDVPMGQRASGKGGKCPYCGIKDNVSPSKFDFCRPIITGALDW